MSLEAPSWWYETDGQRGPLSSIIPWLLSPAAVLYGSVAGQRLAAKPDYISLIPVICIGNFTAGGTGKTPLAIDIATRLKNHGARPTILTRGYGGTVSGPYDVDPDSDTAGRVGDEPLLLARAAPTVVCRDRIMGAKHIERTDATVIIMDDGMQNPKLAKTLSIAVVDGTRGFGNAWTIPSGPLRAPIEQQALIADAIVVNGELSAKARSRIAAANFSIPIMTGNLKPATKTIDLAERPIVAFCGIGNPSRFHKTLEDCRSQIRESFEFPDHHAFNDNDAEKIIATAKREDAIIVTTEKDRVRLISAKEGTALQRLFDTCLALPVAFEFKGNDSARLDAMLDMVLRQTKAA